VGQWEGFAGGWDFEKIFEIAEVAKTAHLRPKGAPASDDLSDKRVTRPVGDDARVR